MNSAQGIIKRILRTDASIVFAYLFGSRATGSADDRSDWDIAIYYREKGNVSRWKRFSLEADLSRAVGSEVQVEILNDLRTPLFTFEIISKGILLIDRNTSRRALFEARALAAYHDWQYYQDRRAG